MTPTRIAAALNHIADRIDNSETPSLSAVKQEVHLVVAAMKADQDDETDVRRIAHDMFRVALRRVALSEADQKLVDMLWDNKAGKDVDTSYNMSKRQPDDDKLVRALQALKRDVDIFIKQIQESPTERERLEKEKAEDEGVFTSAPPTK